MLLFAVILVFYFGLNAGVNYYYFSTYPCVADDSKVLIAGDSHLRFALNPKYFSSASNISQNAEPYVLTFWKLKKLLPQVNTDTVILGFGPQNIAAFNDLKFSDSTWAAEMFKRSYPIESFSALKTVEVDWKTFWEIRWKETCLYPKPKHCAYIGEYENFDKTNLSDVDATINRHYYLNNVEQGVSATAMAYLDSIVHLCNTRQIALVMVSSPVHQSYYQKIPPVVLDTFNAVKQRILAKGIAVIDETAEFYPDSLYYNADHINADGATRFTHSVLQQIGHRQPATAPY